MPKWPSISRLATRAETPVGRAVLAARQRQAILAAAMPSRFGGTGRLGDGAYMPDRFMRSDMAGGTADGEGTTKATVPPLRGGYRGGRAGPRRWPSVRTRVTRRPRITRHPRHQADPHHQADPRHQAEPRVTSGPASPGGPVPPGGPGPEPWNPPQATPTNRPPASYASAMSPANAYTGTRPQGPARQSNGGRCRRRQCPARGLRGGRRRPRRFRVERRRSCPADTKGAEARATRRTARSTHAPYRRPA